MRVAFFTYPSAFQNIGGGEIQLLKTREYLEKEGQAVTLFDPWRHCVEEFDLIHVFSSVGDCLGLVQEAKVRGVKVVTSPVLWSDIRRALFTDGASAMKMDLLLRHAMKWVWPAFPSARRKLLISSDLLFPNSEIEKKQIARLFAVPSDKIKVVPNGVDPGFADADPSLYRERQEKGSFILSVGRIEPRKNQLNLIRAVKAIKGARLHLIGNPVSGYEAYYEACRREGQGFTSFLPGLSHENPLLKSAYAACEVFVLPGWFETPGLAALEASLAGANVVVTIGGSTREYFHDTVDYLDPSSPSAMREKIVKSIGKKKSVVLKRRVLENFTWDKVAKATARFYGEVLR